MNVNSRQVHSREALNSIGVCLTQGDCCICQFIQGLRNSNVGLLEEVLAVDNSACTGVERKRVELVIPASCINEALNQLIAADLVVEVVNGSKSPNRCKNSSLSVSSFDQVGTLGLRCQGCLELGNDAIPRLNFNLEGVSGVLFGEGLLEVSDRIVRDRPLHEPHAHGLSRDA